MGFGDRYTGRGTFRGAFAARHCNMGTLRRRCATVPQPSERLGWCVRWVEALLYYMGSTSSKGKGRFGAFCSLFSQWKMAIESPTVKCFRFICENFTTFPFGKRIVGKLDSRAFWRYIRFQDQGRNL